jgi:hypothetical protein
MTAIYFDSPEQDLRKNRERFPQVAPGHLPVREIQMYKAERRTAEVRQKFAESFARRRPTPKRPEAKPIWQDSGKF